MSFIQRFVHFLNNPWAVSSQQILKMIDQNFDNNEITKTLDLTYVFDRWIPQSFRLDKLYPCHDKIFNLIDSLTSTHCLGKQEIFGPRSFRYDNYLKDSRLSLSTEILNGKNTITVNNFLKGGGDIVDHCWFMFNYKINLENKINLLKISRLIFISVIIFINIYLTLVKITYKSI